MKKSTAAWRVIGGQKKYFRSIWEANYARYLEWTRERGEILEWQHEPKTFWFEDIKRGVRSYKPDFYVYPADGSSQFWIEVKGFYDSKSLTKIKRMKKYYPNEKLILIDASWFAKNNKKMSIIIRGWEHG